MRSRASRRARSSLPLPRIELGAQAVPHEVEGQGREHEGDPREDQHPPGDGEQLATGRCGVRKQAELEAELARTQQKSIADVAAQPIRPALLDELVAELGHVEDEFRATEELDDRERLARTHDLQYIGLDGTVGIIANGAGLAMSTLDVVNQVGGTAANFLDIGGGANADMMAAALEVINFDSEVKSILINIFGGITRGEEVAKGIVEAMSRVDLRAPIVIRLDGTNAEQGREILASAGIPESKLISKPTMLEAARTAVAIANGSN